MPLRQRLCGSGGAGPQRFWNTKTRGISRVESRDWLRLLPGGGISILTMIADREAPRTKSSAIRNFYLICLVRAALLVHATATSLDVAI